MGTYVPQRVAKLSRAISRLQRRNVGGRQRNARHRAAEKEIRKRGGGGGGGDGRGVRGKVKVRAAEARESGRVR